MTRLALRLGFALRPTDNRGDFSLRHPSRFTAFAAAAIVASLLAAGCGGDDDDADASGATGATGVSGESLTMAQFVTQADAICAAGTSTIDAAAQGLSQVPEGPELEQLVDDTVVPALQAQYDGIAALPAPEGEEDNVESLLSSLQAGIDEIEENPESLTDDAVFADANAQAQELGLTECGEE